MTGILEIVKNLIVRIIELWNCGIMDGGREEGRRDGRTDGRRKKGRREEKGSEEWS